MDKETNHNHNPNHHTTTRENTNKIEQLDVRKGSGSAAGDRVKRDEWSEGAVSSLLEAYETKWVLRNRAKLKGQDWEDVARHVSSRGGSVSAVANKSPKTQTQCKNKIESMKKRYRSESAIDASSSTWPLYSRLHLLLRGASAPSAAPVTVTAAPVTLPLPPPNSHGQSNGVDFVAKQEEEAINKNTLSDHASDKNIKTNNNNSLTEDNAAQAAASESSTSTPAALYSEKSPGKTAPPPRGNNNRNREKKRRRRSSSSSSGVVAESVRWLAEAVVKSERVRAEATQEIEKMRAETEARRSEMELRRTEIIANTQLEIARIFAGIATNNNNTNTNTNATSTTNGNKAVDSSLRIGRN